jgi:hypothetical protein
MLPALVQNILDRDVRVNNEGQEIAAWARLNGASRGYGARLLFALLQAQDRNAQGVVAVIDSDKHGQDRFKDLKSGRATHREKHPPIPTALGCAEPHCEAWLLDSQAVMKVLDLGAMITYSNQTPKGTIDRLIRESRRREEPVADLQGEIAGCVTPEQCKDAQESGLMAFAKELNTELGKL